MFHVKIHLKHVQNYKRLGAPINVVFHKLLTSSLRSTNLSDVQLNMSGLCQPPISLSQILETFPWDPFGHDSLAIPPKLVLGHQIPSDRDLGHPS